MGVGILGWGLEKLYKNVHCGTRYLRIPVRVPTAKIAHSFMSPCGQGPEPPTTVSFQQTFALCEADELCHAHPLLLTVIFYSSGHTYMFMKGRQDRRHSLFSHLHSVITRDSLAVPENVTPAAQAESSLPFSNFNISISYQHPIWMVMGCA